MTRNTLLDTMNLNISIYLIRQIPHFDNSDIIVVSQEDYITAHKFYKIDPKIPESINKGLILDYESNRNNGYGYLNMCAWMSHLMFLEPFLQEYDIITKIDTDGFMKYMVSDIPKLMYDNKVLYSSSGFFNDAKKYTVGLDITAKKYCEEQGISCDMKFFENRTSFNCNLEMINLPILKESGYLKMSEYFYNHGGIYYYRWGDSPIKYIIFNVLGLKYKIMRGIEYKHQDFIKSMFE